MTYSEFSLSLFRTMEYISDQHKFLTLSLPPPTFWAPKVYHVFAKGWVAGWPFNIPLMYNLILWNNFPIKKVNGDYWWDLAISQGTRQRKKLMEFGEGKNRWEPDVFLLIPSPLLWPLDHWGSPDPGLLYWLMSSRMLVLIIYGYIT